MKEDADRSGVECDTLERPCLIWKCDDVCHFGSMIADAAFRPCSHQRCPRKIHKDPMFAKSVFIHFYPDSALDPPCVRGLQLEFSGGFGISFLRLKEALKSTLGDQWSVWVRHLTVVSE